MFAALFYALRGQGVPVSPTSLLRLQRALDLGLVGSLDELYAVARGLLVKSERHFDAYDQVFAHVFAGAALVAPAGEELDELSRALLAAWLDDPAAVAEALGLPTAALEGRSPDELLRLFQERLAEQDEAHRGGAYWIGTRGRSPYGHGGHHPGGLRIGGRGGRRSAVRVALERRWRDYDTSRPLTQAGVGEALRRLRHLVPAGPADELDIAATIRRTVQRAGELELVWRRGLRDRLAVLLAIDNGGWSMEPYVELVQTLFDYSRAQFSRLTTVYFHNTLYERVWEDPPRRRRPMTIDAIERLPPETRLILVGDAAMAPYELLHADGAIGWTERGGPPSIVQLRRLAQRFPRRAWLNPLPVEQWRWTRTVGLIGELFEMFPLTLDGLERAVGHLLGERPAAPC